MRKAGKTTKSFLSVFIAIWGLVFGSAVPVFADLPGVCIELTRGRWLDLYGDSIDNNSCPYYLQWMLRTAVVSSGPVTGPRVEFTSDGSFVNFDPYPTSIISPSTYIWDYPYMSLAEDQEPLHLNAEEHSIVASPGFTAIRSVDNPILLNDVSTQTMSFTLRFEETLSPAINHAYVDLGTFYWNQ